ncbi:MAG: ATP-binding cassette domain-containing protein [Dehalococcoidia bacterium]|nr:ATP-binding cassette domain-containing protein [Dehalococcoidia bacterium]
MRYFVRLLPYLRPHKGFVAAAVALTIMTSLVGLALPWPLQILIDNALGDRPVTPMLSRFLGGIDNQTLMLFAVLSGFGLALLHEGLQVISKFVNTKIEQRMIVDFRSDLFSHAQRLSMSFHDRRRSGSLIYAINYQASAAARLIMTVPPMAYSVLMLVGMFWILLQINLQLALVSLAVVPFLYGYITYYATHIQDRMREVKAMEAESLAIVHEGMSMVRVIAAFAREPFELLRFRNQGNLAADARVKLTLRETLFNMAVNTTTAAGTALVLGVGAYFSLRGDITTGQLMVAVSYLAAVYKPLTTISYTVGSLQDMFVSLQISFNLLDTQPEVVQRPNAATIQDAEGRIAFDQVDFSYSKRGRALEAIEFEAAPGTVIGLVGPTGAGKTTLASLIPRFYDPTAGRVLLDGRDVRDYTLRSLREQISLVLQEPLLFSGSIEDNIRYGRLDARMDEVIAAAKAANAHDFITALPDKYETQIGERGARLSGGERQRICIARAFLKGAPVLILDEPTSAVDSRTESVILDALERLMAGRTTFMIAHRLSTIRRADLVLVMDHGRIVERGRHEDLKDGGGLYSQLYQLHTGEPVVPAAPPTGKPTAPLAPQTNGSSAIPCPQCATPMTLQDQNQTLSTYACVTCSAKLELPSLIRAGSGRG